MDLESENSALESTGDNDLVCSANPPIGDDVKIEFNGSSLHDDDCDGNSYGNGYPMPSLRSVEIKEDDNKLNSEENDTPNSRSDNSASLRSNHETSGEDVDGFTVINSAGKGTESDQHIGNSPASPGMSPSSVVTKGKGLRKWRRIRREVTKDNNINLDVTKMLKRGSANRGNSFDVAVEMKQKSEGSVSSTNAFVNNPVSAGSFSNADSSSVYKVAGISTFSVGADSDNSEDRSSKSSTAASVPKSRHDPSRGSGHSREKHKVKHTGRKHLVNTPQTQRVQQGARQLDAGKKPRGEAVNVDQENSLSSLESDSRNYCSLFMQGSSSAINNGHSERLMGSDGEHSDDEQAGEQQSVEGLPTGPCGSVGEDEETSQVDAAVSWPFPETIKNHKLLGNGDLLVDCAQMLRSLQETLEQEIQKFGELGKEDLRPLDEDLIKSTDLPVYSNSAIAELLGASSNWPASEDALSQEQTIEALEKQLEEKTLVLKEKESRIAELESTIHEIKSSNETLGTIIDTHQKKYMEMESEMEVLLMHKTEAEIKFVAIADKIITEERQMKLLLAEQKSQESSKTDKSKSVLLKDKAEEEGGGRVTEYFFRFFVQLILFVFVLEFFVSRFLPNKSEVVMPT